MGPGALNDVRAATPGCPRHDTLWLTSSCGDGTSAHAHHTRKEPFPKPGWDRPRAVSETRERCTERRLRPRNPPRSFTLLGNRNKALTQHNVSTRTKDFYKIKVNVPHVKIKFLRSDPGNKRTLVLVGGGWGEHTPARRLGRRVRSPRLTRPRSHPTKTHFCVST